MKEGLEDAPAVVYEDNKSAITVIRDREYGARTKFLDVRLRTLRERERDRAITLQTCSTIDMIADTLTKPLPLKAFVMLSDLILSGVPSPSDGLDKGE